MRSDQTGVALAPGFLPEAAHGVGALPERVAWSIELGVPAVAEAGDAPEGAVAVAADQSGGRGF